MSRRRSKARLDHIESYLGVRGHDELLVNTTRDSIQLLSDQLSKMNGMLQGLVEKGHEFLHIMSIVSRVP